VTVEILGRTFTLKGSVSQGSLQAVAREVDAQLRELQQAFPTRPLSDLAILAALNLAYECLESKEDHQQPQTNPSIGSTYWRKQYRSGEL